MILCNKYIIGHHLPRWSAHEGDDRACTPIGMVEKKGQVITIMDQVSRQLGSSFAFIVHGFDRNFVFGFFSCTINIASETPKL